MINKYVLRDFEGDTSTWVTSKERKYRIIPAPTTSDSRIKKRYKCMIPRSKFLDWIISYFSNLHGIRSKALCPY